MSQELNASKLAAYESRHAAELKTIGEQIGYGRACQILGDLWDAMLEREYGVSQGRGKMERRHDIEKIEAVIAARATVPAAQQAGWVSVRDAALDEAAKACMRATPDRAKVRALGEAAHYVACADAIRALQGKPEAANGWEHGFHSQSALHAEIDKQIAIVDAMRLQRLERRLKNIPVENERRNGLDRRAGPLKD